MKTLTKNEWVAVVISILFVGYALFGSNIMSYFNQGSMSQDETASPAKSSGDLIVKDLEVGSGDAVKAGDTLTVNYVLSLPDGTVIQDSKQMGKTFSFVL